MKIILYIDADNRVRAIEGDDPKFDEHILYHNKWEWLHWVVLGKSQGGGPLHPLFEAWRDEWMGLMADMKKWHGDGP